MDISRIAVWEMPVIPEFAADTTPLAFLPAPADAPMSGKATAAADFAPIIQERLATTATPAPILIHAAEAVVPVRR